MSNQEELLKLLEEETNKQVVVKAPKPKTKFTHAVEAFIRKNEIKPGPLKVATHVVYYHFTKFTNKYPYYARCKKEEFFRNFKKHFEQKRTGRQRFYMLNDSLELSENIYEKAEKYKKRTSKKSKSTDKISRNSQEEKSTL